MTFLRVQPKGTVRHISLAVIKGSLEVVPDVDISITDLNRGNNNTKYKHFFNSGNGGITFKCTIVINKNTKYKKTPFLKVLNDWIVNSTVLDVSTNAIDVRNGSYIITKNSSRKQTSNNYSEWELEFTTYRPLTVWKFKNNNTEILKALKKAKGSTAKKKKKKKNVKDANKNKLSKCNLKVLVYSKKKKKVECVKYLQKALQKNGFYLNSKLDGWYGKDTVKAVKSYQKKFKLKKTGKIDKKTLKKLCE